MSASDPDDWASHWMIFDIATQHWTFFINDLNFVRNCCDGSILTIRNVHYYFNNDVQDQNGLSPMYRHGLLYTGQLCCHFVFKQVDIMGENNWDPNYAP